MNPEDYKNSVSGQCIWQPEGYWAFIPKPLPPELEMHWDMAGLLADAHARLGELSGAGSQLQNPHLLIQPYIRREAVLSSRIEDTQAGMDDLYFFEADDSEPPRVPDVLEVSNYVHAMEYGLHRLDSLPICTRLVLEIHERLMHGVRGGYATPGEFRRSQNWIGAPGCTLNNATYVPPPVEEMHEALSAWERYLNGANPEPLLIQCALMHAQFELIHPFLDGNGRIGRLLIPLFLYAKGLLSRPLLYISSYFERYRNEYYERLLAVSQQGDWRGWIEFFLRGVATQAQEAYDNAAAILDLNKTIRDQVRTASRAPKHTLLVVERLFTNPVVSAPRLARELDVHTASIQRCLDFLVDLEILKEVTGKRRNRLYVAPLLIDILKER